MISAGPHHSPGAPPEHIDVLVIGAGISGIAAAYRLQTMCPDRPFAVLEGREALGGTWDLFRYPGVRSDSDMHTLGFDFKPWTAAKSIADGPAILAYLNETVDEFDIRRHIRFGHQVSAADWSSEASQWTVTGCVDGEPFTITTSFLFMCTGYYSYRRGYRPTFAGEERFSGPVIHPQEWPDDLDYTDQRVLVIGSGATAVTLVPALAERAAHVTMLQRSPTWMVVRPEQDRIANWLRRLLPNRLAYRLVRAKNAWYSEAVYKRTRTDPDSVREKLLAGLANYLPQETIDAHFTPDYNPWDQRLCLVPNADLFTAINNGRAEVVTDHISTFTETGVALASGRELPADIIVTATGLQLVTIGEMAFSVDGRPVDFSEAWTYKGLAYSDLPNLVSAFGYINASWTLRADLVTEYGCRLLNHMAAVGASSCTPVLRPEDDQMARRPWIEDFTSGYMERMMPLLPKQGDREPWVNTQRYSKDKVLLREAPVDDGVMQFR